MDNSSGVGVLDKAALVLSALESGPATLAGLVAATGLARPTAHRLAVALEHHRMVARDMQGRFILGPRLAELAAAAGEDRLLATAGPVLTHLRDVTGESAQLYRRQGDMRICVAAECVLRAAAYSARSEIRRCVSIASRSFSFAAHHCEPGQRYLIARSAAALSAANLSPLSS